MLTSTIPLPAVTVLVGVDRLAELDVSSMTGREQADLLRLLGRIEAKVSSVRMKVLAAADAAGTPTASGAASAGQWAAKVTNSDQAPAHREAGLALSLADRPTTRRALAEGVLSSEHAQVIVRATQLLPDTVAESERSRVEASLVDQARELPPQALRRVARRAIAVIEADERKVDAHENQLLVDEEAAARAKTRLSVRDNGDGTLSGSFTVPTLPGSILVKVLQAMTAPRRGRLGAREAQVGAKTERTDWDHARGLAFCELLEHLPTDHLHPKTAATLVVRIDEEGIRRQLRAAGLDTGEQISAGAARRLACNAGLLPAVLSGASLVLDLGRERRLFSEAQRIALGLTYDSCAADGCERPFAWCELHHRRPWASGGRTDLRDAVPLCHFHHQRVHDTGFNHRFLPDGSVEFTRRM